MTWIVDEHDNGFLLHGWGHIELVYRVSIHDTMQNEHAEMVWLPHLIKHKQDKENTKGGDINGTKFERDALQRETGKTLRKGKKSGKI